jgi:hypothetical protein
MKSWILSALTMILPLSVQALETDNYLAWEVVLPDSADKVNDFMNSKVQEALNIANARKKIFSCKAITARIAEQFKTTPTSKSLEEFVNETLDKENIFPKSPDYLDISILHDTRFYLKYSGLAPNIQISGFYFGADKLSHFASTGRRYFNHYLKKKKKGFEDSEAVKSAIRYGLLNEASVLGWWASGVFSYGDMEANFQGFLYYKKMCSNEENNYLAQDENGKWQIVKKPDLRDYVSAYWDETYNQSIFSKSSWPVVSESIQQKYCGMKLDSIVTDRMSFYQNDPHTSFSLEYIKELQASGYHNAPVPKDFGITCGSLSK